ncbi:MAG: PKD domain-containing protein, partial [Chromatiales bacterium]
MRSRMSWRWALPGLAVLLVQVPQVSAESAFLTSFNNTYSGSASGTNAGCQLCHGSRFSTLNEYGFQYQANGFSFSAVAGLTSVNVNGGTTMLDEINAGTQPGWTTGANNNLYNVGATTPTATTQSPPANIGALDPSPPPSNTPPVADAGGPYAAEVGQEITFDGTGSSDSDAGDTLTYAWNFGDGNTGTGPTPTHTYASADTFQVTLVVSDGQDDSAPAQTEAVISALNIAPVADPGGPYSGEAGTTLIQFDGSASRDDDGDPLSFEWNFGDGTTATGMMPTHTYATADNFEVTLRVSDGRGGSDSAGTSASITAPPMNGAPTADPGGPYTGEPGVEIQFDGSGSTDPNPTDTLTYSWDFGDGGVGSGVSPVHTYTAAGPYDVMLTVSDGQGAEDMATTTATIEAPPANRAPTADAGGPYSGETGASIQFDGRGSSDPDGNVLRYSWDFGDGTTDSGATPTHVYSVADDYTVRLVVSDGELSDESTVTARITDPGDLSDGEILYDQFCAACHGADPWAEPAVDETLPGLRRVAGSRECNIYGSIFGTSVFPDGAPGMEFLQSILSEDDIAALAEYLNSRETTGEQRYVSTCAGCHGNDGSGGRTDEDVHGDSAGETLEAIGDEQEMRYLSCMPGSDIDDITEYLRRFDDDLDDDGIDDDHDSDDDGDGIRDEDDDDDDNDGVSDDEEREHGTDPRDRDSDDDRLDDGDERDRGTNPRKKDTDDDGLEDGDEASRGTDPTDSDTDGDGASDGYEVNVLGTNPLVADGVSVTDSSGGGGGCTIASRSAIDPTLPAILALLG